MHDKHGYYKFLFKTNKIFWFLLFTSESILVKLGFLRSWLLQIYLYNEQNIFDFLVPNFTAWVFTVLSNYSYNEYLWHDPPWEFIKTEFDCNR